MHACMHACMHIVIVYACACLHACIEFQAHVQTCAVYERGLQVGVSEGKRLRQSPQLKPCRREINCTKK